MADINADWHKKNVMPKNATMDQRIKWHKVHARLCGCRPIPKSVQDAIDMQEAAKRRR